jgi:hypothetical protein
MKTEKITKILGALKASTPELCKKIDELNALNADTTTVANAIAVIEQDIKEANAAFKATAIENAISVGEKAAETFVMSSRRCYCFTRTLANIDGKYELQLSTSVIGFSNLCKAYRKKFNKPLTDAHYAYALELYNAMCVRKINADIDAKFNGKIAAKEDIEKSAFADFKLTLVSNNKLEIALNTLVKWMFPTMSIKMYKADVNYIMSGFTKAKDGTVKCITDSKLEQLICDAVKVRASDGTYSLVSKSKAFKKE